MQVKKLSNLIELMIIMLSGLAMYKNVAPAPMIIGSDDHNPRPWA